MRRLSELSSSISGTVASHCPSCGVKVMGMSVGRGVGVGAGPGVATVTEIDDDKMCIRDRDEICRGT